MLRRQLSGRVRRTGCGRLLTSGDEYLSATSSASLGVPRRSSTAAMDDSSCRDAWYSSETIIWACSQWLTRSLVTSSDDI
jgi:hypothetical protein